MITGEARVVLSAATLIAIAALAALGSTFIIQQPVSAEAPAIVSTTKKEVTPDPANKNGGVPWSVYTDQTAGRVAPRQDAESIAAYNKGSQVFGEYYTDPDTDEEWIVVSGGSRPHYVLRAHLTRVHPANLVEGNLPIGTEIANRWWAVPIEYEPSDLVAIPGRWGLGGREYRLRQEANDSLVTMLEAASADGVEIRVISAYRSGPYQVGLYQNNINRNGAKQRSSAPPGHSEHQLGTTVDLTDHEGRHNFSRTLDQLPVGMWLEKNAVKYGWVRSYYPYNIDETGYISEPWHWRYFGKDKAPVVKASMEERARAAGGS